MVERCVRRRRGDGRKGARHLAVHHRYGEHEFVLGNIIGSNLFNTLAVVGLATVISPLVPGPNGEPAFSHYILTRDVPLMIALSLSIMFFGMNWKHPRWPGVIQRKEALAWLLSFAAYTAFMIWQETGCR